MTCRYAQSTVRNNVVGRLRFLAPLRVYILDGRSIMRADRFRRDSSRRLYTRILLPHPRNSAARRLRFPLCPDVANTAPNGDSDGLGPLPKCLADPCRSTRALSARINRRPSIVRTVRARNIYWITPAARSIRFANREMHSENFAAAQITDFGGQLVLLRSRHVIPANHRCRQLAHARAQGIAVGARAAAVENPWAAPFSPWRRSSALHHAFQHSVLLKRIRSRLHPHRLIRT
jgi:hypothetical protein